MRKRFLHSQFSILNSAFHVALFIAFSVFYALTLNGDVQPADSGEFQIAAITLGIPHPPGYPLFTMLGWLFVQIPIGSPYARVSFLSVVASAATLVLVSLTVKHTLDKGTRRQGDGTSNGHLFTPSPLHPAFLLNLFAGVLAALALGLSTTFWAQATTTNIRSLTAFFTALMLYASARAYATRRATTLVLFAVAFGLGVGHHVSLIFVGVVLGAYVFFTTWRARNEHEGGLPFSRAAIYALVALAATQLVWLYLPIRDAMGARFAPGTLTTLDGLLFHIFARGFAGDMLAFAGPEFLFDRLATLPTLLTFQFSLPILIAIAIAAIVLLWRRVTVGVVWLIAFVVHLFITITYRAPQTVEYAMPCWVIVCVMLGAGLSVIAVRDTRYALRNTNLIFHLASLIVMLATLAFILRDATQRWPSFVYLARNRNTRANAEAVLQTASRDGVVLSQWHQATPMWALQDIEGVRPDVRVEYVFPRGAQPYAETFAKQAAERARQAETSVTSLFQDAFRFDERLSVYPHTSVPAWRVTHGEMMPDVVSPSATFDQRLTVIGPLGVDAMTVEAGQTVEMDVWWRTARAHADDSITVRVMRPDGRLAANADIRISPDERRDRFYARRIALGIPLDLPPGQYEIVVGAYQHTGANIEHYRDARGQEFAPAATINVIPATWPPATQQPMNAIDVVATVPRLIGVDYDTGIPGQLRVWTHWQLGEVAQEIALLSVAGEPLAPAKLLSAATSLSQPEFLSLPFDIIPKRGIRVSPSNQVLPDYSDGQRYIPFANQMALIGSSARRSGASLQVDLRWLAARPLTNDYIASMRVEGNGLYKTHDGVPALGTIPTLKWIRGSHVTDRHPFDLGDYRDALSGSVVVYDSVSQLPLPPLDERYDNRVAIAIP